MILVSVCSVLILTTAFLLALFLFWRSKDKTYLGAAFIAISLAVADLMELTNGQGSSGVTSHALSIEIPKLLASAGVAAVIFLRWTNYPRASGAVASVNAPSQLTDFLNRLQAFSALINPDGRYEFLSDGYAKALELKAEDAVGHKVKDVLPPTYFAETEHRLNSAFQGKASTWSVDMEKPSGEIKSGLVTYLPINRNDNSTAILVIVLPRSRLDQAEQMGRLQTTRQVLAADLAGLGYLECDADGSLIEASKRACRIFQRTREQIMAEWGDDHHFLHPDDRADFGNDLQKAIREGSDIRKLYRFQDSEGRGLYLQTAMRSILTSEGMRLVVALQDVTEQQEVLNSLNVSEQRFRDFADTSSDWIWEDDIEGKLTFLSAGYGKMAHEEFQSYLGLTREETGVFSQDGEFAKLSEAAKNRQPFRKLKINFTDRNNQSFNINMSGKPYYDSDGNFKGYRGTCIDLTDINAAEDAKKSALDAFGTAFENISSIVALFDKDDRLVYCNRRFRDIYADPNIGDVIGADYADLVDSFARRSGLSHDVDLDCWARSRKNRRTSPAHFLRTQLADGRWIEVSDYPVENDAILTIGTEITDKVLAEEVLHRQEAALQVFNRRETIGQMAAAIAHELNQPLSAINNFAAGCVRRAEQGLLKEDDLIPVMTNLAQQSDRASAILRSMSDYLWSGDGERNTVSVTSILSSVSRLVQPESKATGIPLDIKDHSNGRALKCAEVEIEQLLINLVKNAFEATAAAKRTGIVTLTANVEGDMLLLSVRDNGTGFDGSIDSSAFEPFRSTKEKGLGVGLAICRTIVDSHQGSIKIAETGPSGSKLLIRLPLVPVV